MENLVYELVNTQYVRSLHALKNILLKAKTCAETKKFNPNCFLDLKLAPDMFNFTRQVQLATDNAKGATARLTGTENPVFEDTEKSWEELIARVDKTINFITKYKASDFKNFEEQKITFPWYPGKYLEGRDYLVSFAIPNYYFHLTTAYNILRNAGAEIGKGDFLGEINWK